MMSCSVCNSLLLKCEIRELDLGSLHRTTPAAVIVTIASAAVSTSTPAAVAAPTSVATPTAAASIACREMRVSVSVCVYELLCCVSMCGCVCVCKGVNGCVVGGHKNVTIDRPDEIRRPHIKCVCVCACVGGRRLPVTTLKSERPTRKYTHVHTHAQTHTCTR